MATTAEKLVVELDAKIGDYKRKMREAGASGEKAGKKTAAGFKKADKEIKDVSSSLFKFSNVARGVAAAIAAIGVTQFADQLQIAENQLKNVTSSTEQFVFVQQELNRIAMETRQNVSELTSVYARFARAGQEAGFTQQEVLSLTESLTKAFKIEGNEVSEVNSILLQLTQSFRKGRIDGEEFRAVSEGSTQVLQALAKQMGVNIGELKELGAQGLLTPRELAKGLENLKPEIDRQFKDLGPTFSEVGTALGNVFAAAFKATGLQGLLGVIKREIVDFTNSLNESISEDPLTKLNFELTFLQAQLSQLRGGSNPITELLFDEDELERQIKALRERIATLQTEAAGVLDVTIKKGDTDLQLQRQAEFQEMLKELKLTGLETDEEIFIKTVELHKAMLD
jgi:tape measure domain-containing protein